MRVAFVTTFLPSSRSSGADIASMNLVEALRLAGHEVQVHGYASPTGASPAGGETAIGPCTGEWNRAGIAQRIGWTAAALARGRAVASQKFITPAYLSRLDAIASTCEAWILDHHYLDWLLPRRRIPTVAVVHNIEHVLLEERARRAGLPQRLLLRRDARLLRDAEQRVLRTADAAWCFADQDAQAAQGVGRAVSCVPLCGLDPGDATAPPVPDYDAAILGLWTWEPNRRGLEWFLAQVLPLLPADFRVAIGGLGADGITADPRVRLLGFVPDAMAFLRSARALVIPSTTGGGVQVKTINALNLGMTTIATPFAMRGLEAPPWAVIAGSPDGMARELAQARGRPFCDAGAGRAWQQQRLQRLSGILDSDLRRIAGG
ncbi:MAG: glycosyltransferase [Planctomycetes bacterium]|nr:glycosyltransferase [Planctomycetota bacterium]